MCLKIKSQCSLYDKLFQSHPGVTCKILCKTEKKRGHLPETIGKKIEIFPKNKNKTFDWKKKCTGK